MPQNQQLATELEHDLGPEIAPLQGDDSKRLGSWLAVLSAIIAFLVVIGGIVRLSGSGLSIPEWPLIQGSLLPPMTETGWQAVYDTYYKEVEGIDPQAISSENRSELMSLVQFQTMFAIEYFHRFLAALVGIVFLAIFLQILRRPSIRQKYGKRLSFAAGLLLAQAILGGIVVKLHLKAELVSIHLGFAFAFFAIILWTAMDLLTAHEADERKQLTPVSKRLVTIGWITLAFIYTQVLSGGLVASTFAGFFFNTWPKMGDSLIPPMAWLFSAETQPIWMNFIKNKVMIQFVHRWWAIMTLIMVFGFIAATLRLKLRRRTHLVVRALASVVVLQVLLGIATLVLKVPLPLAATHLGIGLLLFALMLLALYDVRALYRGETHA